MARHIPHTDVLLTLMGAPHASDETTSALRLAEALLRCGARIQVWTCGYATMLTQRSLGEHKPRNLADWNTAYPSTASLAGGLLESHPEQLYWYACRFCSDDRGAGDHLPQVVLRPPAGFGANAAAADKTLMVGVL
jgi:sulfur relay (sulfurtransferase) complex TusBCD TusD component (DsrE family)